MKKQNFIIKNITKIIGGILATLLVLGMGASVAFAAITSLTLTDPLGGEKWHGTQNIAWTYTDDGTTGPISILLSSDSGANYNTLVTGVDVTLGSFAWDTTETADGLLYSIQIKDLATGIEYASDTDFTIDNTAPATTYEINPESPDGIDDWYKTAPVVTFTCTDATSGCASLDYSLNGGASWINATYSNPLAVTLDDGEHSIQWRSTDKAGNVEAVSTATLVKVDTTAPTLTIADDEDSVANIAGGDVTFTFTFSEDVTGFEIADITVTNGTEVTFDTTSATEYTLVVTPTANFQGDLTVSVAANVTVDIAGNENSTATTYTQEVDTLAPVITTAGTITLTTDANGDGIASIGDIITYAQGDLSAADADTWTVDLSAYGLSATAGTGEHEIIADDDDRTFSATETVTDDAGNTGTGPVTISDFTNIDNIAPVVTIGNISITGGTMVGGVQTFNSGHTATLIWDNSASSGDDNSDIVNVIASLTGPGIDGLEGPIKTYLQILSGEMTDTEACGGTANDNIYETCIDLSTINIPEITLTNVFAVVTAFDEAKNTGTATDETVTILDTEAPEAPEVTLLNPINSVNVSAVTITGIGEAYANIAWSIDDVDTATSAVTGIGAVTSDGNININGINVSGLNDGTLTVTVTLTDRVENSDAGSIGTDTATKDTLVAGVSTITTTDTEAPKPNGSIDTVVIEFDDELDKNTFTAADFKIGDTVATGVSVAGDDNSTVTLTFTNQIAGTDKKTVVYTAGSAKDAVGNPITGFSIGSTDAAGPVPMSAKTINTTQIEVVFSEEISETSADVSDFFVDVDNSGTSDVDITDKKGSPDTNVIILTLNTEMNTGDTPDVTILGNGNNVGLTDMGNNSDNWSPAEYILTATDGVSAEITPVVISTSGNDGYAKEGDTVTITITASEDVTITAATIDGTDVIASATVVDTTSLTVQKTMGSDDTEQNVVFAITVQDSEGNEITVNSTTEGSEILYDRTMPSVNAGDDKEVNNISIQSSASASDNGSGILSTIWTGDSAVTFHTNDIAKTSISANADRTYTLTLTVTDQAGNVALDTMEFIWDQTNPEIITSNPANGNTETSIAAGVITITFDEPLANLNSSRVLFVNEDGGTHPNITETAIEGNSIKITYDTNLLNSTTYRINVKSNAVTDIARNNLQTTFIAYFTTIAEDTSDQSVPAISSVIPTTETTGVALNVRPTILFDDVLDITTVNSTNVKLWKVVDEGNEIITAVVSLVEGGKTIQINPISNLENGEDYRVEVTSNVKNEAGLAFAGSTNVTTFTTEEITPIVIDSIVAVQSSATADDTFENGWRYTYHLTVNSGKENMKVRFNDWVNSVDEDETIEINDNTRALFNTETGGGIGSVVGSLTDDNITDGFGDVLSFEIGNTYEEQTASMVITSGMDTNLALPGVQIQFDVFTKLPSGTTAGIYTTSYGIRID